MSTKPLLVLIVSGWGIHDKALHPVFNRLHRPFLGDYVSSYPLIMVSGETGQSLRGVYEHFDLSGISTQTGMSGTRLADPDRFGLLAPTPSKNCQDVLIPFPPGKSLAENGLNTIAVLKKRISAVLREEKSQFVVAAFTSVWTASLYGEPALLAQAVDQTSQAVHRLVEEAMEAEYRVLICSDTAALAPLHGEQPASSEMPDLLPVMLIHPSVEGLRAGFHDTAHHHDLPMQASGQLPQLRSTMAALLAVPMPAGSPAPLFADLIALTL